MKKLYFILSLFGVLCANDYSLVFVHIGRNLPQHLEIAINQAKLFNPEASIYLVANKSALENFYTEDIVTVSCESLKISSQHKLFNKTSKHNTSFREGFWRYATERFFYIDELIKIMVDYDLAHTDYGYD